MIYTVTPQGETQFYYKSHEHDPELAGLGPEDVGDFWYTGVLGDPQQALVVYPTDFDARKVYDLAFHIHGGPQMSVTNKWNGAFNLKVWADQGYIVVAPNPTGSAGYGQALTDRIRGQWGGLPYDDLVLAHTYACENLPYVNCSNAVVAMGHSYGGYMINWIQGQDFGRKFKALICVSGIATKSIEWTTDSSLHLHEIEENSRQDPARPFLDAWNPLTHAANFSTPQFIVANEQDFRVPMTEGLAMFNILQSLGVPSRFLSFASEGHTVED